MKDEGGNEPSREDRVHSEAVPMMDLSDRVAIVTGASRGLGRAIASALAARGAHVVAADRGDHAAAIAAEIR